MAVTATYTARGVCYAAPMHDGMLWLYNGSPNLLLQVAEIRADQAGGGNPNVDANFAMPFPGRQDIVLVSAFTGGTTWPARKMSSASASLPAQVTVVTNAYVTPSATLRQLLDGWYMHSTSQWTGSTGLNFPQPVLRWRYGKGRKGRSQATAYQAGDGTTQPISLAEGEGIAISRGAFAWPMPMGWTVTMRNPSSGDTYFVNARAMPAAATGEGELVVFNASGSGITLEVMSIEFEHVGETFMTIQYGPIVRLVWCNTVRDFLLDPFAGALPVVAHRSDQPCPSTIQVLRGPFQPILPSNQFSQRIPPTEYYDTHGTVALPAADGSQLTGAQIRHDLIRMWRSGMYCKDVSAATYLPNSGQRSDQRYAEGILYSNRRDSTGGLVLMPGCGMAVASQLSSWYQDSIQPCSGYSSIVYDLSVQFTLRAVAGVSSRLTRVTM